MSDRSTDVVTELRQMAATGYAGSSIWAEAADEIERLRAGLMLLGRSKHIPPVEQQVISDLLSGSSGTRRDEHGN